ncbi:MAG TPA: hypothetical protein VGE72_29940 [Azospirillum sp.]
MAGTGKWITGGAVGILAFIGLFAASRAQDSSFYWGGFLVFVGCVAYIFHMIDSHYGRRDSGADGHTSPHEPPH